jgi:hypothetical protein
MSMASAGRLSKQCTDHKPATVETFMARHRMSVDEYRLPPSADRREFHRVHALVSDTAEKAGSLVELAESLKAAIMPHHEAPQR